MLSVTYISLPRVGHVSKEGCQPLPAEILMRTPRPPLDASDTFIQEISKQGCGVLDKHCHSLRTKRTIQSSRLGALKLSTHEAKQYYRKWCKRKSLSSVSESTKIKKKPFRTKWSKNGKKSQNLCSSSENSQFGFLGKSPFYIFERTNMKPSNAAAERQALHKSKVIFTKLR